MLAPMALSGCWGNNGPLLYNLQTITSSEAPLADKAVALGAAAATYSAGLMASCPDLETAGRDIFDYTQNFANSSQVYATEDGRVLTSQMMQQALKDLGAAEGTNDLAAKSQACAVLKDQVMVLAQKINQTKLPVGAAP